MTEPFRVLSMGWGCQSWCLAAMSALGVLPKVDFAIHADTTWERSETYDFAQRWTPWLEERGVRIVIVTAYPATQRIVDDSGQTHAPLYTVGNDGLRPGQLNRSCTQRWKIAPIRQEIRSRLSTWLEDGNPNVLLPARTTWPDGKVSGNMKRECIEEWKLKPIRRFMQSNRDGAQVHQWIGITLDEVERARLSDVKYIKNVYPFLRMARPMRRGDVIRWLQEHDLEVPVKSSCVMCPYHDRATWRAIKNAGNGDWQKAVMVDEIIRHKRPNYVCYLTPERKPLVDCDFSSPEDHGQLVLWGEECSGMCWL